MTNKRRGLAIIFNQERFFWRLGLNDRHGTNADCYNLEIRYFTAAICLQNFSARLCILFKGITSRNYLYQTGCAGL